MGGGSPLEVVQGWQRAVAGATVYFGSAASDQRFRAYDKNLESDGEVDAIRYEMQLRDEAAETMVKALLDAPGDWGSAMAVRLVSMVDFREPGLVNTASRPRMPWYEELVGGLKRARCYPPEDQRDFADLFEYYWATHAQNIAVIMHRMGEAGMEQLAVEGKRKWREKHRRLARA